VSRKIERLINLTIALLATKRYLTKSEIFNSVEGYEGTPETKERMFERDKDDLRSLGIEIEVGSFDPLFKPLSNFHYCPLPRKHGKMHHLMMSHKKLCSNCAQ